MHTFGRKTTINKRRKNLQRDYLIEEKNNPEETTARYGDESYQWTGGFD